MLTLERVGDEVFCEGKKLTIVKQASKGLGKEVVKIEGLEGSNNQSWISLKKIEVGTHQYECSQKVKSGMGVGSSKPKYERYNLTPGEKEQIKEYQSKIDEILETAKKRVVPKNTLDVSKLSKDELKSMLEIYESKLKDMKDALLSKEGE